MVEGLFTEESGMYLMNFSVRQSLELALCSCYQESGEDKRGQEFLLGDSGKACWRKHCLRIPLCVNEEENISEKGTTESKEKKA